MWECRVTFALPFAFHCQDAILGTEPFSLRHLYLLHPTFPSILLDLANATGTVTASEGQSQSRWGSVYTHEAGDVLAVCEDTLSYQEKDMCFQMTAGHVC